MKCGPNVLVINNTNYKQIISKNRGETLPNSFHEGCITLITKPEKIAQGKRANISHTHTYPKYLQM